MSPSVKAVDLAWGWMWRMSVTLHSDKGFAARLVVALSSSSVRIVIGDKFIAARLAANMPACFKIANQIVAISNLKKVVSITEIVRELIDYEELQFA